jgi:5-hydroxyisourate hydrolase-like protein (transthyretin family)
VCCVTVISFLSGDASQARAEPFERPCTAFWNAAAVFTGRLDSIQRTSGGRRVTFTILERFRVPADPRESGARTMDLDLPSTTPCASRFRRGREYLVYAGRDGEGLSLAHCSRTREIEDAAADLSYARSVLDGSAPAGTINGRVVVSVRDLSGRVAGSPQPAAGVAVRVASGGRHDETLTNDAGDFTLSSSGPGPRRLAVDVPHGYYGESTSAAIELRDPRACGDVELRLAPDGRVAGRVVDSRGRPVAGLTIELSTINLARTRLAVTNRDGRYELTRLPAGRFVVGVATGAPGRSGEAPRVFLPGVSTAALAARFIVGEGERLEAPELRLPLSVKYVAISGFVLDAEGTPAEGAQVYVKGANEGDRIVGKPVAADFVGRFTVAALADSDYVLFAERRRGSRVDSSDQIRLMSSAVEKPIHLFLHRRY